MLTGEDAAERPLRTEVVDDNVESHLDLDLDSNDLHTDFYDYSYDDADKYVYITYRSPVYESD